ncbi:MAG: hypothetical protein J0I47_12230 [Sphingomonas sp.]|uniref:tetratricopeptide repeat protein n=1 Tax=Sphingomonas sp. TaxID=28214 RepID=UPI001AC3EC6F|nr:hypothetical protein [Sphingomonas sp.]MBN8808983.1 hypothetical protein [Sphingomonas sp.]
MRRLGLALVAGVLLAGAPAAAQNTGYPLDARVTQLEKRMNTVERVLTRQNGGPLVQPEIGPADPTTAVAGTPATAPLADLDARVAVIERATQGLTNRVETAEHRLGQLEADFAAYRRATDARLAQLEARPAATTPTTAAPLAPGEADGDTPPSATPPRTATPTKTRPAADPERADRVAAVAKPTGADAADKGLYAYNYGYRLWKAGLYPEAEAQLDKFDTRFPKHRLVSRARNVLGLVLLDDNRPKDAAQEFYDNYSKLPDGDRASESLLNLARALTVMKRPAADICQVYKEVGEVYGDKLTPAQKADVTRGRATYKCK